MALSTDVIVAFPGESPEEFEDTLDVLREVRFDDAYTYRYSPREGTPATRLPAEDFIADDEAQGRLERLIEVHREIQGEINRREVGRVEEVLVEKTARKPGQILGRTGRNKVVAFQGSTELIGTYQTVSLTATTGATVRRRAAGRFCPRRSLMSREVALTPVRDPRRTTSPMSRIAGPLGVLAVLVVAMVFTALNGGQRVTVDLGIVVLNRVPVTMVAFGGLFTGMVVMLIAGVQSDLKVRAILRQRLKTEDREERALIDRTQQELFATEPPVGEEEEEVF